MNLTVLLQEKAAKKWVIFESYFHDRSLSINGRTVEALDQVIIKEEEIPYIKNMLTTSDYVLYGLRKGTKHLDETYGESAVRFHKLPRAVRDEIYKEAPNTGDNEIFLLSYYGK